MRLDRRFQMRFRRWYHWLAIFFASVVLASLPLAGNAVIGFNVAGLCLAACGSDSLLNRAASDIGSAFTDGAVQHFGDEGRAIVDYANSKAQERLQQLEAMIDEQRKLSIRDIATQRQLFTNSLNSLVNTAANDLRKVLSTALQQLDQSLKEALDQLDSTLRANVGSIGVILASFGGLLFALVLFALLELQKIVRRTKISTRDLVYGGTFVLAVSFCAGLGAHAYNNHKESQLLELWEQQISNSVAGLKIAKAAAIARRIDSLWPSGVHEASEIKLAVVRDFLLGEQIWDTGALRTQAADAQAARYVASKSVDADILIVSAYLQSKANDALIMNDVIQKFLGSALLVSKNGELGPYEEGLRMLGCDLYRTIEVANTSTRAHVSLTNWINALGDHSQQREEYVMTAAKQFGVSKAYAEEVLSRERPIVPSCTFVDEDFRVGPDRLSDGTTASDMSSLREIAVLQHALQVRRQVLLLEAAGGLWLSQCLFSGSFEMCPATGIAGIPDVLEQRYAWLNGIVHAYFSRGIALSPPVRAIATLQFLKWLSTSKHRFKTGAEFEPPFQHWLDNTGKSIPMRVFAFDDPDAKPSTLCTIEYPGSIESAVGALICRDYKLSPTISPTLLAEIEDQAHSYLLRLTADNVKGFSDARTTGVISGLYEIGYRKALADVVLSFNDAVELNLAGILNRRDAREPPVPHLEGDKTLIEQKPDSPLWEVISCERRVVDAVAQCEGSGKLEDFFQDLDKIGKRSTQSMAPPDIVMKKLNTVFAF